MNYHLLKKLNDLDECGSPLSARMSAVALLESGLWPVYKQTPRTCPFNTGDRIAVYILDSDTPIVIATAKVRSIDHWTIHTSSVYPLTLCTSPSVVLHLNKITYLDKPVDIKSRLAKLSFIKPGVSDLNGCLARDAIAITRNDFATLSKGEI